MLPAHLVAARRHLRAAYGRGDGQFVCSTLIAAAAVEVILTFESSTEVQTALMAGSWRSSWLSTASESGGLNDLLSGRSSSTSPWQGGP